MNEEQKNPQELAISIGDILSAVFCKKIVMLIVTLSITLVGVLGIKFIVDRPNEVYTAGFHLNVIDLEKSGTYIDGSNFDYRDIISLNNLNRAKETDSRFSKIDADKLLSNGSINIGLKDVYDEEVKATEKKAVVKETYYQITLKKTAISNKDIARDYIKALVNLAILDNIAKTETMDYSSNLTSYDSSNRYDAQITYLENQFNMIINGYNSLESNYGNVTSSNQTLSEYKNAVQTYFNELTFANLKSDLDQYGYIKDYEQNGRVYYTSVNNNVDTYNTNKSKLDKLIAQRDDVLNKYSTMNGTIENTGLDAIYNHIDELTTSLEDIKHTILINLRRLAGNYTQAQLEQEFAEALVILELANADSIYASSAKGNEEKFKSDLARFRVKLNEYTNEYKKVTKDVVSTYSAVYFKDSAVVELDGGLGIVKALLISVVAGFFIACVVNLVLGREKLSFEYRLKRRIERAKQYGLLVSEVKEENKE